MILHILPRSHHWSIGTVFFFWTITTAPWAAAPNISQPSKQNEWIWRQFAREHTWHFMPQAPKREQKQQVSLWEKTRAIQLPLPGSVIRSRIGFMRPPNVFDARSEIPRDLEPSGRGPEGRSAWLRRYHYPDYPSLSSFPFQDLLELSECCTLICSET